MPLIVVVGPGPAATLGSESATIQWESAAVRVLDLPSATVGRVRDLAPSDPGWSRILGVHVVDPDGSVPADRPAILGTYRLADGNSLAFHPRFPFDAARCYRAKFDPDGPDGPTVAVVSDRTVSPGPGVAPPRVVRIEPTADRVPANLLKFYLYFDQPMGRGSAYDHLALVDADGNKLDHPFLELGEELWDPSQTRLTVLLDPGRVKRGLRPREELGPIFFPDRSYTLRVDAAWRDAAGQALVAPASKTFTTSLEDETSPDPKAWRVIALRSGTTDPLLVTFGEPLDRATVASGLALLDAQGTAVPGTTEASLDGTSWRFAPAQPWPAGSCQLAINPDLEDLAGNSIRRPFEVDVQRDVPVDREKREVRLPIAIIP